SSFVDDPSRMAAGRVLEHASRVVGAERLAAFLLAQDFLVALPDGVAGMEIEAGGDDDGRSKIRAAVAEAHFVVMEPSKFPVGGQDVHVLHGARGFAMAAAGVHADGAADLGGNAGEAFEPAE